MIKYLVFDLDGTLIRSQGRVSSLLAEFLFERFGVEQEATRYFFHSTRGMAMMPQLMEYLKISSQEAEKLSEEIYELIRQTPKGEFFLGVVEKIKELSQNFRLFLSTGNSAAFALENLEKGGIKECFEVVLGSEKVAKSAEHFDYFAQVSGDAEFRKFAVMIGDGEHDAFIAHEAGMEFIHIEEQKCSFGEEFCASSVAEISPVLDLIIEKKLKSESV